MVRMTESRRARALSRSRQRRALRRLRRERGAERPWRLWAILALACGALGFAIIGGAAAAGYMVYRGFAADLADPSAIVDAQRGLGTSRIYDSRGPGGRGALLYEFVDPLLGLRDPVRLHEVSQHMIDATIATEDASFWENEGVNVRGLLRAAWENLGIGDSEFLGGSGGSSITQQLVKNVLILPEERSGRTLDRLRGKVKETILAIELTGEYSKEQILAWYLNTIFYGNLSYGVGAASQRYFGKPASELTLAESALLAGLPQAPSRYNPLLDLPAAKARQAAVLGLMAERGFITRPQAEAAARERLAFDSPEFEISAPHFVLYVQDQVLALCEAGRFALPEGLGGCAELMSNGGLRITTTLDRNLQALAERELRAGIAGFEEETGGRNGAAVALEPATGRILAMVGSRDFFREDIDGQVNLATAPRSPGSAIKPLTYLAAFEDDPSRWHPATVIWDVPTATREPDGTLFQPINFDSRFRGPVTARSALANSMNVPAFRIVEALGTPAVLAAMQRTGITTMHDATAFGPSITLGGGEVSLLDLAYAYSVLANNGEMRGRATVLELGPGYRELDPVAVLEIRDSYGRLLYRHGEPETRRAADPAASYQLTHILSDNDARSLLYGAENNLELEDGARPAAAKTGTAGQPGRDDLREDLWTLGYTPQLIAGVWIGNADGAPMHGGSSSGTAGLIWNRIMTEWHAGRPVELFSEPPGLRRGEVHAPVAPQQRDGGDGPRQACTRVITELFSERAEPPPRGNGVCISVEVDERTLQPATARTPSRARRELLLIDPPVLPRRGATALDPAALNWLREHRVAYLHPPSENPAPPYAELSTPSDGARLPRGSAAIHGRAHSPDLLRWRVTARRIGQTDETVLAEGWRPVEGGKLAEWDASGSPAGRYRVTLAVEDAYFGTIRHVVETVLPERTRNELEDLLLLE